MVLKIELTADEKIMVILRDDLYDGSWEKMRADLRARLKEKAYIAPLCNRIHNDLVLIDKVIEKEKAL